MVAGLEGSFDIGQIRKEAGQPVRECMRTYCNTMSKKIDEVLWFLERPGYHKDEYGHYLSFLRGAKVALESLNAYEDQFE